MNPIIGMHGIGMQGMPTLEICVDDAEGLHSAAMTGPARIELCSALDLGGLTPGYGLVQQARSCAVPVFAMIRPRPGNFCFTAREEAQMLADIALMRDSGLAGVVLGAAHPDHTLDLRMLERLSAACGPMRRQLHRVVDLAPDPFAALDAAIALGFERVLSSGQASDAVKGAARLKAMHDYAEERIEIMAGSGVRPGNVVALMRETGVRAVHASCRKRIAMQDERLVHFGFAASNAVTSAAEINQLLVAMASMQRG
ncbi:copper homeostasis protein CutC [Asaia sp. VD9]|uniref:copper homeostasis protein CutC n=1 Tax=Asaia sp. VD9 TaxID=3081235 RepID=UPI0030188576